MKKLAVLALLVAFVLLGFVLLRGEKPAPSLSYFPTPLSESWPTFTDAAAGFRLKYPGNEWRRNQSPRWVTFSSSDAGSLGIICHTAAEQKFIDEEAKRSGKHYSPTRVAVKIGNLSATRIDPPRTLLPSDAARNGELFSVRRRTHTYAISWTPSPGRLRQASQDFASICREMVSTFEFVDFEHPAYLTYTDPLHGLTLEYPSDWQLTTGAWEPVLRVSHGATLDLALFAEKNSTFESYRQRQGNQVTQVEERREHFDHHLSGWRYKFLDHEAYAFEHGAHLYVIWVTISTNPALGIEPRKPLDDILNTLRW